MFTRSPPRTWFVGDLHGCRSMLVDLMEAVNFDTARDRIVCAGDLVDRGPESLELLQMLSGQRWFTACSGNHDAEAAATIERAIFSIPESARCAAWAIPAARTIGLPRLKKLSRELLKSPLALTVLLGDGRTVGVVHGQVPIGAAWGDVRGLELDHEKLDAYGVDLGRHPAQMIWGRTRATAAQRVASTGTWTKSRLLALQPIQGIDLCVSGHEVLGIVPTLIGRHLFLDTGAGYAGGRLSFVDIESGECVQHDGRVVFRHSLPTRHTAHEVAAGKADVFARGMAAP